MIHCIIPYSDNNSQILCRWVYLVPRCITRINPFLTHILLIKVVNDSASETSCWWKQRKSGTMIAIDYHNSCETPTTSHSIPERSFQIEEVQEVKIFCQPERLQPQRQAKHNSMRQTALNSSSNSCCCYIWTCQSDQEKKKKMNHTPSNWQSQIRSWMCWFQDQYKKHSLQIFVQSQTIEDGDVSALNWKLLTIYFQVMKGEIVRTYVQRRQTSKKTSREATLKIKWIIKSRKPRGRLLGPKLVVYALYY